MMLTYFFITSFSLESPRSRSSHASVVRHFLQAKTRWRKLRIRSLPQLHHLTPLQPYTPPLLCSPGVKAISRCQSRPADLPLTPPLGHSLAAGALKHHPNTDSLEDTANRGTHQGRLLCQSSKMPGKHEDPGSMRSRWLRLMYWSGGGGGGAGGGGGGGGGDDGQ
ncbi:hypothetical protein E2C01_049209 [Portunus trituberculatus]|uniref:Uncharacterized protein n=1 Tax=Portunus trituberculatus TaxID=210409 RepID=A0A5B7GD89_PORTR|nr:hypothetical protein [Portunus trituberculatus]